MTGYILVNAEQFYEEPFYIIDMQYLQRDETFREISDLALSYFVEGQNKKGEYSKFQIVRLFKNDDTGNNYNVYLGEFRVNYEVDYSNLKTSGVRYIYYLQFVSDNEEFGDYKFPISEGKIDLP